MPSCLNCKKPAQDALCQDCHATMKKAQDSAPKVLFPYLLPKNPTPTSQGPANQTLPIIPKPMVLEIRPRCLADKTDGHRCAMPSTYFFCQEHARQWFVEKRTLESRIESRNKTIGEMAELLQEQEEKIANMEANNHSLAKRKEEEIKDLYAQVIMLEKRCKEQSKKIAVRLGDKLESKVEELEAQLKTAEKCDECSCHTPELLRFCLDCYPAYVKDDLAEDPYLREEVLEPYLKEKDEEIRRLKARVSTIAEGKEKEFALAFELKNQKVKKHKERYDSLEGAFFELEKQLLQERQRNAMLCDTIRTQGIRILDLESIMFQRERNLKKQRKGKRELQELQEGVRTIWGQEAKRPKKN